MSIQPVCIHLVFILNLLFPSVVMDLSSRGVLVRKSIILEESCILCLYVLMSPSPSSSTYWIT